MKILIPMAGQGKRFLAAGYQTPKPLIPVEGMPMIEHIIHNFSIEDDFVFGVNEEHLKSTPLAEILKRLAPRAGIVAMPYQKAGPIGVLKNLFDYVEDGEPVIVNYCDFSWSWDYEDFKKQVAAMHADGAVLCYRGFHPHLLGPNLYATLDADGPWMKAIREKHTWHGDKQQDWTSSGTYYFRTGALLKQSCQAIEQHPDWKINGEFYVSQLYQVLKDMGKKILISEIPFMLQWGTPEDLEEYRYGSDIFRAKAKPHPVPEPLDMTVLVLMAGAGKRFEDAGYRVPKPLIPVDGKPMVVSACESMPRGRRYVFAARQETLPAGVFEKAASGYFPKTEMLWVDKLTEGQACTALLAREKIQAAEPVLIAACDHGAVMDPSRFSAVADPASGVEAVIFTFRGFPPVRRNPKAYGWVETDTEDRAVRTSVKIPLPGDPLGHHAIMGAFWFRRWDIFTSAADETIRENRRVNNEFYIDEVMNSVIRRGHCVKVLEIDRYIGWGTPEDLKTYEYWQRFFSQAWFHPYGMEKKARARA